MYLCIVKVGMHQRIAIRKPRSKHFISLKGDMTIFHHSSRLAAHLLGMFIAVSKKGIKGKCGVSSIEIAPVCFIKTMRLSYIIVNGCSKMQSYELLQGLRSHHGVPTEVRMFCCNLVTKRVKLSPPSPVFTI